MQNLDEASPDENSEIDVVKTLLHNIRDLVHTFVAQHTQANNRQEEILCQGLANLTNASNEIRKHTTLLGNNMSNMQESLKFITESLASRAPAINESNVSSISNISQPASTSQIFLSHPEIPPSFRNHATNPIRFIKDLEKHFKKNNVHDAQRLEAALDCLDGPARNWSTIYRPLWNTYDDFRKDFLHNYWSELDQGQLRHKILTDSWNNHHSMGDHFAYFVNMAQQLTNPFPESELVSLLMRHFPVHVQSLWALKGQETLAEAADFLKQQENIVHFRNNSTKLTTIDRRARISSQRTQPYQTDRTCPPSMPAKRINAVRFVTATDSATNLQGNGGQSN